MTDCYFNIQTIHAETGDKKWITVRAPDLETARNAAAEHAKARGAVLGEIRPADPRAEERAAASPAQATEEYNSVPIEAATESHASKKCGVCGAPMGADSNVCGLCAFDKRKGIQTSTLVRTVDAQDGRYGHRIVACKECGYDLSGLPTAKCPECGTNNIRKHDLLEGVAEETLRAAYMKPIIAIGVGFAVTFGAAAAGWQMQGLVVTAVLLALLLPLVLVVVSLCLIMWIGVDSVWKLTFLQILGAAAMSSMCASLCAVLFSATFAGSGVTIIPSGIVAFFALVASLCMMLEIEVNDAALAGTAVTILGIGELLLFFLD